MKKILFILLFVNYHPAFAQKQTYLLLAYGQRSINAVCGEKLLLKKEEIKLLPIEASAYRTQVRSEIIASLGKGYTNIYVELVPETNAIIFYEFEKVYTPQKDGWNCTNTQYGCTKGKDMLAAESAFASQKAQYSKFEFKEVWRWGKPAKATPAALGEQDLDVNWNSINSGYLLELTNKRTDIALQVTIVGYKNNSKNSDNKDLSKMTKSSEVTLLLEPGHKTNKVLSKASSFEIRIIEKKPIPMEKDGYIEKVKQIIKQYATEPGGADQNMVCVGVRG